MYELIVRMLYVIIGDSDLVFTNTLLIKEQDRC
jgi:hypothetical protein